MLVYVTSSKCEVWDPKIHLQKEEIHGKMHSVMAAVQILATCARCSVCASLPQKDRTSNPVSKTTEDSIPSATH